MLDLSIAIADQLRDHPLVPSDPLARQQELHRVAIVGTARVAGQEILWKKGATSFGIGAALVRIIRTILHKEQTLLTVSGVAPASASLGQVCLSSPSVIGRSGIGRNLCTLRCDVHAFSCGQINEQTTQYRTQRKQSIDLHGINSLTL